MGLVSVQNEPNVVSGNIDSVQNRCPSQGPSLVFQGDGIIDPRFVGTVGAALSRPIYGIYSNPYLSLVDGIPVALAAANIAAAQNVVQGTAMTLATAQTSGISPSIPLVPFGLSVLSSNVVNALALDYGFGLVKTTAASTTLTPNLLNTMKSFFKGQNLLISGAGATANAVLNTTVSSVNTTYFTGSSSTTTLTVSSVQPGGAPLGIGTLITGGAGLSVTTNTYITALGTGTGGAGTYTINNSQTIAAGSSLTGSSITVANAAGQTVAAAQVGSADPSGITSWPFVMAGDTITLMDPTQSISRAVSITGAASNTGGTFLVRGYDVAGQPMSEQIVVGSGVTTAVNGKKAFKYIASVTPTISTDTTHAYSVGTTDIYGFTVRSDFWEYMNMFVAGSFITSSTGWVAADPSSPALTTTGDVRGTYALQTPANGTNRLAAFMSLPVYNAINANNLNYATMYGQTQA